MFAKRCPSNNHNLGQNFMKNKLMLLGCLSSRRCYQLKFGRYTPTKWQYQRMGDTNLYECRAIIYRRKSDGNRSFR